MSLSRSAFYIVNHGRRGEATTAFSVIASDTQKARKGASV